ncbi:hypothetical protein BH24GEM1_BH24GEM1_10100 [soil metagenome]
MATAPESFENASTPSRPLVERVRERVDKAAASLGDKRRERRGTQTLGSKAPRELRALRRVFREMGRTQRTARRQTGQAPSPVVRDAARAFRAAPSMSALVLVAASLDEVGLLSW